jgi:hypothetical protein
MMPDDNHLSLAGFRRRQPVGVGLSTAPGGLRGHLELVLCKGGHLSPKALCLALGPDFAALLACGDRYRALARSAIIHGDRPIRPDFEKPHLPSLAAARLLDALRPASPCRRDEEG